MVNIILLIIFSLILVSGIIIAATSYTRLTKTYNKYSNKYVYIGLSGLEFTDKAIDMLDLKTKIAITEKDLDDCYIPKKDVVVLSKRTAESATIASLSISAHELGHAVQNKNNYFLFEMTNCLKCLSKIASVLLIPSIVIGIILICIPDRYNAGIVLLLCGLGFWAVIYLLKLTTIPLEYNASKLAYKFLKDNEILTKEELKGAKKMLKVAGSTYVANMFYGIFKFFRSIKNSFRR